MSNNVLCFDAFINSNPTDNTANDSGGVDINFSFFSSDNAKNIPDNTSSVSKKKTTKPKVAVNGEVVPDRLVNPIPGATVAEVDYASSYNETNNLIRGAIIQADELSAEIKQDLDSVRASKINTLTLRI